MAIWEFLDNLSIVARKVMSTTGLSATSQDDVIEGLKSRRDDWLSPRSVAGYEPEDFEFLSDDERSHLSQSVQDFLESCDRPSPTADQVAAAAQNLADILGIVRPDKYSDPEALKVGKRIEAWARPDLPGWISELKFQTGSDSTGDESIWIRAIVDDVEMENPLFATQSESARRILFSAAQRYADKRWPYISFRSRVDENQFISGLAQ